jgi:predicted amidohydrolase YtcJ
MDLSASLPAIAAVESADLVLINGKIYTADAKDHVVQAMGVLNGRILAVGSTADVKKRIGKGTRVVDLKGAFITPGFGDNHFHNEGGGNGIDLANVRTLAELSAAIGRAAKASKPGELLITNSDWHEAQLKEQRLPTARELDLVTPENPLVVVRGGHSYILNSLALAKYGITKETVVPPGGAITRDASGELTGELIDNARRPVQLPPPSPITAADIEKTQTTVNQYGITSIRIPGFYKGDTFAAYALMKRMRDNGQLTVRFNVYFPGFGVTDPEKIHALLDKSGIAPDEGDDWVKVGGIKLGVDGGFEGGHMTEAYAEPYGHDGTYFGLTTVPPAAYTSVVRELNRMGWRVTSHAVGDAGIDQVIAAYQAANADSPLKDKHWAIEHLFISRPDQLTALKAMGIWLSVQDHLYLAAPSLKNYLGANRAHRVTPIKTYLDAGFIVSGGTDTPVIPFNPFWELYHYATRDTISDGVYGPEQSVLSRTTLLRLLTINYAYLTGEEAVKGSLEVGKLADFAVLDRDFLTVPIKDVPNMKALATYVGGRRVYGPSSL